MNTFERIDSHDSRRTKAPKFVNPCEALLEIMRRRLPIKKILSTQLLMGFRWFSLREVIRILQSVSKVTKSWYPQVKKR